MTHDELKRLVGDADETLSATIGIADLNMLLEEWDDLTARYERAVSEPEEQRRADDIRIAAEHAADAVEEAQHRLEGLADAMKEAAKVGACRWCGSPFLKSRRDKVLCSNRCKVAEYGKRKKDGR